jgi:hypothetical protein
LSANGTVMVHLPPPTLVIVNASVSNNAFAPFRSEREHVLVIPAARIS